MKNKKIGILNILMGILGAGLIILGIIIFTNENAGELFKDSIAAQFQVDFGLYLLVFGIKKNRIKGKPAGNKYFMIGLAILTTTAFTIYNLFTKLA